MSVCDPLNHQCTQKILTFHWHLTLQFATMCLNISLHMCTICLQLPQDAVLQKYSEKEVVFKNFAKIAGKHLCLALFMKIAGLKLNYLQQLFYEPYALKISIFCVFTILCISQHETTKGKNSQQGVPQNLHKVPFSRYFPKKILTI